MSEGKKSRTTLVVLGLTVASLAIQLWIAARPDTMGDVSNGFRLWCRALAEHGLEAYWHPEELQAVGGFPLDHPPVTPYLYWIIGKSFAALAPQAFLENDVLVDLLIKLPFVIANLLLGLLVFRELRRHTSPRVATWGFAAVALNPALIFNTSYWGQTDSLCALGVAAAFAAVFRRRYALAWAAIVFAALVKPFGYAFVPLLGLITLDRAGLSGALRGLAGGVAATFLLFLPFMIIGRFVDLLREILLQLDAMPYVSVNAHNLWWILGGGLPFYALMPEVKTALRNVHFDSAAFPYLYQPEVFDVAARADALEDGERLLRGDAGLLGLEDFIKLRVHLVAFLLGLGLRLG